MMVIACLGHYVTKYLVQKINAKMIIPELVRVIGPDGNRNYLVTYDSGYSSVLKGSYG